MNENAENLINELFDNPIKFNKNKFKGYYLLEEFQKGLDLEILISILESNNYNIYNTGVSIASELSSSECSFLLPYLIPLIEQIKEGIYFYYLLESIYKGTYEKDYESFVNVIKILDRENIIDADSVMHFISIANDKQIKASYNCYELKNGLVVKCLFKLINYRELDFGSVMELIRSSQKIEQFFGAIIAKKLYDIFPMLIKESLLSTNESIRTFAENVLEENEEML